jgi:hypothetical protein
MSILVYISSFYYLIHPTTILKLPLLYEWWNILAIAIAQYGFDSSQVKSITKAIADCANLEFSLHELTEADLAVVLKAIAEVNFESKIEETSFREASSRTAREPSKEISLDEYKYQTINGLINAKLAIDLESALKVASLVNHKDLSGYLKDRINFLNQDKIDSQKEAESLMQELEDGSFWGGGATENGQGDFQSGLMKAMGLS